LSLRVLVVEGNTAEGRAEYREGFGQTAGESYAETLRWLAPDAACEILLGAEAGAAPALALDGYDAVVFTGSALNLYDGLPECLRQVDIARAVFRARTPAFGSCWGLQVATAAAGGTVFKNPRGREIGIARSVALSEAGSAHPLLAGRPPAFEALCSHLDIVAPPPGGVILAANAMAPVQAAEIVHDGGRFWGVQYHPEFSFSEIAAIIERRAAALAREGLAPDAQAARDHARDLRALDEPSPPPDLAWRLGVGEAALTRRARTLELANFIDAWVRPAKSARGRA
jgi:GMP synthase (glutamine-hydrolysing)